MNEAKTAGRDWMRKEESTELIGWSIVVFVCKNTCNQVLTHYPPLENPAQNHLLE
jgi:hypothetical protein